MSAKIIVLKKLFTRDFTLLLCQIWGKRYESFFGVKLKNYPQNVFLFDRGVVTDYRNIPAVTKEVNGLFKKKMKADKNFINNFSAEYLKKAEILQCEIDNEIVTRKSLLRFCDDLVDFWYAIYAGLQLPIDKTVDPLVRKKMKKFRAVIGDAEYVFFSYLRSSLRRLYPKLGNLADYISWKELKLNRVPSKKVLERRKKRQIIFSSRLVTESQFRKLQTKFRFKLSEDPKVNNITELVGQSAYKGVVQGLVRKVLTINDVRTLKKNEILVSHMTVPDFIPAMKKASAFVTDEGGITCHAAIIAREMQKPCIIGTKIVTRVLKDGDLVEVDANKGIVKVLKK